MLLDASCSIDAWAQLANVVIPVITLQAAQCVNHLQTRLSSELADDRAVGNAAADSGASGNASRSEIEDLYPHTLKYAWAGVRGCLGTAHSHCALTRLYLPLQTSPIKIPDLAVMRLLALLLPGCLCFGATTGLA